MDTEMREGWGMSLLFESLAAKKGWLSLTLGMNGPESAVTSPLGADAKGAPSTPRGSPCSPTPPGTCPHLRPSLCISHRNVLCPWSFPSCLTTPAGRRLWLSRRCLSSLLLQTRPLTGGDRHLPPSQPPAPTPAPGCLFSTKPRHLRWPFPPRSPGLASHLDKGPHHGLGTLQEEPPAAFLPSSLRAPSHCHRALCLGAFQTQGTHLPQGLCTGSSPYFFPDLRIFFAFPSLPLFHWSLCSSVTS